MCPNQQRKAWVSLSYSRLESSESRRIGRELTSNSGIVKGVFSSVASSYDVMNDAMSLGIHRLWKDHYVQKMNPHGGMKCLDVAGGTGDIAIRLLDHAKDKWADRETSVIVLDINPEMLEEGKKRFAKTMYHGGEFGGSQLRGSGSGRGLISLLPFSSRTTSFVHSWERGGVVLDPR